jgi:hypothetical protein
MTGSNEIINKFIDTLNNVDKYALIAIATIAAMYQHDKNTYHNPDVEKAYQGLSGNEKHSLFTYNLNQDLQRAQNIEHNFIFQMNNTLDLKKRINQILASESAETTPNHNVLMSTILNVFEKYQEFKKNPPLYDSQEQKIPLPIGLTQAQMAKISKKY